MAKFYTNPPSELWILRSWRQEHKGLRDVFTAVITAKIGKPIQDEDLANLDEDAVTPEYEVYQDDLEGTDHVPNADANATTPEDNG